MALFPDQKLRMSFLAERRPLMLKDYLRDDLSSCSSNGFKSCPRRQCCTTVRFLLEIDLKTAQSHKHSNTKQSLLQRSSSKAASTTISALQRASEALRNAVKQLPFHSIKSPSPSTQRRPKKGLLPRSLSRKLLKRNFWRKAADREEHTIKRWKLFREFLEEKREPSDQNTHEYSTTTFSNCISTSTSSKSNSNSWAETDFAADIVRSSSGNSEISIENDTVESRREVLSSEKKLVSNRVGASVGEDSIGCSGQHNTKDWPNDEEKEQFSPVSVLDCPFEDDKDTSSPSSPFQHRLARMEGTKQKLMQKIRRFESLAQLEPVDLEKRIALSEHDDEILQSPVQSCSISILDNNFFNEDEEDQIEKKVRELLELMRSTSQSNSLMCKADNLLSDFFREKIEDNNEKVDCKEFEHDLLKVAQHWIRGQSQELLMGWEVEGGRKAYVTDMEKNGKFRNVKEEKEEVGFALELEIITTLVTELALDLIK